ncbi:MAG: hypothetical protein RML45_02655 [Acetobacteraceae bacterium]|nr:hypothetical protein [Acetobacteraceae bacterium]
MRAVPGRKRHEGEKIRERNVAPAGRGMEVANAEGEGLAVARRAESVRPAELVLQVKMNDEGRERPHARREVLLAGARHHRGMAEIESRTDVRVGDARDLLRQSPRIVGLGDRRQRRQVLHRQRDASAPRLVAEPFQGRQPPGRGDARPQAGAGPSATRPRGSPERTRRATPRPR